MSNIMGFLGWIYLAAHTFGYFNLGGEIAYEEDFGKLVEILDNWPQESPLPIILFRKYTGVKPPPFRFGLVKRKRAFSQGGWVVILAFVETDLTRDLLNQPRLRCPRYMLWVLEDQGDVGSALERVGCGLRGHLGAVIEALRLSDRLTRWLRGGVGWTAGPKPNITLYDIMVGFEPKWRRKPLPPENLEEKGV